MNSDNYVVSPRLYMVQCFTNGVWIPMHPAVSMESCKTVRRFLSSTDLILRTLYVG